LLLVAHGPVQQAPQGRAAFLGRRTRRSHSDAGSKRDCDRQKRQVLGAMARSGRAFDTGPGCPDGRRSGMRSIVANRARSFFGVSNFRISFHEVKIEIGIEEGLPPPSSQKGSLTAPSTACNGDDENDDGRCWKKTIFSSRSNQSSPVSWRCFPQSEETDDTVHSALRGWKLFPRLRHMRAW
jgi:hypothetical protein